MEARQDRRSARTREALIGAFNRLFLARRRGPIRVAELVAEANVGRSTFYEHYAGPEDIYLAALARPFAILADAAAGKADAAALAPLLGHFWENRARAREALAGPSRMRAARLLADLVEARLDGGHPPVPARLAAAQLAEAMLAPIHAWVSGEAPATPEALASWLCRSAAALRAESF